MQQAQINHVAILVRSVSRAAEIIKPMGFTIGPTEAWEGEGTLEIYVGNCQTHTGLLLLMEPQKAGAYSRALDKRGPGLHHVAIDVLNLESFLDEIAGSGWLLHPRSLRTIRESKTAYLARPGMPLLIEVQGREALQNKPSFVTAMGIALPDSGAKMMEAIGLSNLIENSRNDSWFVADDHRISIANVVEQDGFASGNM
jgi:hypothetical protein